MSHDRTMTVLVIEHRPVKESVLWNPLKGPFSHSCQINYIIVLGQTINYISIKYI